MQQEMNVMNAVKSLLAVLVLMAATATVPLVAQEQGKARVSAQASSSPVQVQATIKKIDKDAGTITLQPTDSSGSDSTGTLTYRPTHPNALTMYKEGDQIWADV